MIILLLVLMLVGLGTAIRQWLDRPARAELEQLRVRSAAGEIAQQEKEKLAGQVAELQGENIRLATTLEHERHQATEKIQLLGQAEERLTAAFENLAGKIMEEKGRLLTEQSSERLGHLLQPLKEQLESFRHRVDEVHREEIAQSTRLLEQVRQLQELSGQVSQEANQLAQAIKGDAKAQGDWGEIIIERIFEASGLTADLHYRVQAAYRDGAGRLKRPDFLVLLPDNKALIVDAKVSLTAYERYCSANDPAGRSAALAEHVRSMRRHIEELQAKDYTDLLGNQTLDFVIMCVPLEPAYQAAMQADEKLLYDLAAGHVVVTGPTTLMITLKLIAQIWRRENENRNAERIADRAGRLYDQVALIVDAMQDARKRLEGTQKAFDVAVGRLQSGRGNLVGRVEELRSLGAKTRKQMDPAAQQAALPAADAAEHEG